MTPKEPRTPATAGTGLHACVGARRGSFRLGVDVHAAPGRITALVGPNGAGKTTLLRCIAGSIRLDQGRITLAGRILEQPPRVFLPPRRRRLGIVHQDYLLFPHLDALDNVAFGLRARGMPRRAARARAGQWLDRCGIGQQAHLKPGQLSGGQAQRVALARALVIEPDAVLLDEPLAALDATARPQLRAELRDILAGLPGVTMLVTHDPADVVSLADDVLLLHNGQLAQSGPIDDVTRKPATAFLAGLLGAVAATAPGQRGAQEVTTGRPAAAQAVIPPARS